MLGVGTSEEEVGISEHWPGLGGTGVLLQRLIIVMRWSWEHRKSGGEDSLTDGKNKTKNKKQQQQQQQQHGDTETLPAQTRSRRPLSRLPLSLWLVWLAGVRRQGGGDGVWSCDGRHRALPEDRELDGRPGAERGQVDGQMDGECPARDERT